MSSHETHHPSKHQRMHKPRHGHGHANPVGGDTGGNTAGSGSAPLPGPVFNEPVFAEGKPGPDPQGFLVPHPSDDQTYAGIENLLTTQTVTFPESRIANTATWPLTTAYGPMGDSVVQKITAAGRIVFHAVGDSGASDAKDYKSEISTADQMTADIAAATQEFDTPSFLLHLGDVVYNFGESQYYYDQFYDPFRGYAAPILGIAGNHDSFIVPGTAADAYPLVIWERNFCNTELVVTQEAGSLHRTAMTQPGAYFTVDAPFARIICLFSNALEDPGVISSEGGRWPGVPDTQLDFLQAQLTAAKGYAGALLLALHHPPFSYTPDAAGKGGATHGGSPGVMKDIDTVCQAVGVYPHAVISGHAHNYQRYTRSFALGGTAIQVPFIICGSGGHHINKLVTKPTPEPSPGADVSYLDAGNVIGATSLVLAKFQDQSFGYLRIGVDAKQVAIEFHLTGAASLNQSRYDMVTVDIASRQVVAN